MKEAKYLFLKMINLIQTRIICENTSGYYGGWLVEISILMVNVSNYREIRNWFLNVSAFGTMENWMINQVMIKYCNQHEGKVKFQAGFI